MSWSNEKLGKLLKPSGHDRAGSNNYPVLSITMHEGLVDQSSKFKKRIASRDTASYRVVYTNELVVGFPIDEGVLGFQTKYPAGIVSPAYGIWQLALPDKTHIPYLERYLRSGVAREIYASKMRGGVARRRTISRDAFLDIDIPFPPLDEQKRIAAVLDKADALCRQRQESLQLTEKLLRSVFIDMFGDPEINPMGFPECTIGDLLLSANYGTSAKASAEGTWPVLRMGNITYEGGWDFSSLKYMELDSKEERKYLVRSGEILFNRTNSKDLVGKTAVFREANPMAFAGYLIRCTVNDEADPEYIAAYLNSTHGKRILRSMCKTIVGMANINAKELQAITILRPPIDLQKKFGESVRAILRFRSAVSEASKSDVLFIDSLQQRAFRAELDLSRLFLEEEVEGIERAADRLHRVVQKTLPETLETKHANQAFVAPPEIEQTLKHLDTTVESGNLIAWSADYFIYRILAAQPAPFSFADLMQKAEAIFEEPPPYETIRDLIFDLLGQDGKPASLRQRFDQREVKEKNPEGKEITSFEGRREIVFEFLP